MTGIYKITSPSSRIYIGQTTNYNKRLVSYKNINQNITQVRLYNSFKKYGIENHIFEFIEECALEQLNQRERYYQDLYDVLSKNGLNCRLTTTNDKSGLLSEKTKKKISKSHLGKKLSQITKDKISKVQIGKKLSKETIEKIRKSNQGKIISKEHKEALRIARKNELVSNVGKKGKEHHFSKKVYCTLTNRTWDTITDCSNELNISIKNLSRYLNGTRKNKTSLIYL